MEIRGMRLIPIALIVLSTSIANAQDNPADAADASVQAVPVAAPPPPSRPAELPPKPPKVTCHGDMLTISADNSTLDAILAMVKGCTGAKIDVPEGASKIRSFEELGPGPVHSVLDELLSGTQYNYVIQSSSENPAKVEQVLLTMRTNEVPGGGGGSNANLTTAISTDLPMTSGRRAWAHMQKFDKPDPNSESDLNAQSAAEASFNGASSPSAPADPPANAADSGSGANGNANPAQPSATAETDASGAATASAAPPPAAVPAVGLNSGTDPKSAIQDRINSMQQMFDQRRQMIQKQNTPGQNNGPSN
jgi:hypothetical protein